MQTASEANIAPVVRLLTDGTAWRKCVVTPARQAAAFVPWEKLTAQPVRVSRGLAIKVVTRAGRKEATATLTPEQWSSRLSEAIEAGPCHMDVLTNDTDWHARRTREGHWLVSKSKPSRPSAGPSEPVAHDRQTNLQLPADDDRTKQLFVELGLFSPSGQVLGDMAAKFRQVQHYLELLRPLPIWNEGRTVRVVDAGCGKAYLSLALVLWAERNGCKLKLDTVDAAPDVIETVRAIARKVQLNNVESHATSIAEFASEHSETVDLLVSLHACDTATDEALAAGVQLGARAIVLVPCCHQELVGQIEGASKGNRLPARDRWESALRSGLLKHRLSDIITDSLRSAALEALGYKVDVVEFISPEATARNLMIRAEKRYSGSTPQTRHALERYRQLAEEWAVTPALERLLGPAWPPA
ncbi:MAG: SAM-dependent methyltransferase [bacterium]